MCSVLSIRCLPKMSSLSTSISSQIAILRRSLMWTIVKTSAAIFYTVDGKNVRPTTDDSSPNPVQHDTLPHRHSQMSDLTIRLYSTTSLKSVSLKRWLYHQTFKLTFQFCSTLLISVTWSIILHSDWSIASQLWNTVNMTKYINYRHQTFIFSNSIMDDRWHRRSFNAKLACD